LINPHKRDTLNYIVIDIKKYKPAVPKAVLLFLAGGLWLGVGCMLMFMAIAWLREATQVNRALFAGAGVVLALLIHAFGFSKIVDKNLGRILPAEEKRCVFSFMPWKSYLLIPVMIILGLLLRHSALPKHYLAILYIAIGLALTLSSVRYLRYFLKELTL
jgi:uncharacterized membrane protein